MELRDSATGGEGARGQRVLSREEQQVQQKLKVEQVGGWRWCFIQLVSLKHAHINSESSSFYS